MTFRPLATYHDDHARRREVLLRACAVLVITLLAMLERSARAEPSTGLESNPGHSDTRAGYNDFDRPTCETGSVECSWPH